MHEKIFFVAQQPNFSLGRLNVQGSKSHRIRQTQPVELQWKSNQVADRR